MSTAVHRLTLANGLQVSLRCAPHLKRSAAAVRVQAGSHDAPAAWPGLAHFLEHLLFLGTEAFAIDDGLMRYVQRQGGQVNASTRERSTDFFFEVPTAAFAGALQRLCDMLARPRFDRQRQLREREVIHAEFIAWSRNPAAQRQHALLQAVSPRHPLSGFHAGNRYSLAVHSEAFQTALSGFHQRFYQAGQITLSLAGPQPLDALEALARQFGGLFAAAPQVAQSAPPPLTESTPQVEQLPQQLDVLFACERLPAADQAIAFLDTWLGDTRPGGLLAELRQRGWLQAFSFNPLYQHAGQALLQLNFQLTSKATPNTVHALLRDWLGFFRSAELSAANEEFARLQASRERAASALELARCDSAGQAFAALNQAGLDGVSALLDSMLAGPPRTSHGWRLPAAEPLLDARSRPTPACPAPAGLSLSPALPATRAQGFVFLRWQLTSSLRDRLWRVLEHSLQPLIERAARAAVILAFSECGAFWQLRCSGPPAAVVAVLEQALVLLGAPANASWKAVPSKASKLVPIRQLLAVLPAALIGDDPAPVPSCLLEPDQLDGLWAQAIWQGMATGFAGADQYSLNQLLRGVPGQPGAQPMPVQPHTKCWRQAAPAGNEQALLLFCSVPAHQQAAWRYLAQALQGPFYQRLRVELQLGYAVFSAFRQVQGVSGLVFGVQSPNASHAEIIAHIEAFLRGFCAEPSLDLALRRTLAEQFDEAVMSNAEVADWAWQGQLSGLGETALASMKAAILRVNAEQLGDAAGQLLSAENGWLCLANGPAPGTDWH